MICFIYLLYNQFCLKVFEEESVCYCVVSNFHLAALKSIGYPLIKYKNSKYYTLLQSVHVPDATLNMPKSKKKTEVPNQPDSEKEEDTPSAEQEDNDEWMSKYIGENQMTWFVRIIKTHATKAFKELIPDFEEKLTQKIEERYQETKHELESLQSENKKLRRTVDKLQFQLHKKDEKIKELVVKIDAVAQNELKNDVQMVGLEETQSAEEDMKKVVKLAKEKMGMKLKKSDIKSVNRLGKKPSEKTVCRDLVVTFKDETVRETFYNNRKKTAISKLPQQNIYINDRLTSHRKGLFFQARKLYKARKVFATWTQKGNVLVRHKEDGPITQIYNYDDLQLFNDTAHMCNSSSKLSSSLCSSSNVEIVSHLSDYDYYVEA